MNVKGVYFEQLPEQSGTGKTGKLWKKGGIVLETTEDQ